MEEKEMTRWERVKDHVSRNKKVYIMTGLGVAVGFAARCLTESYEGSGDVATIDVDGDGNNIDAILFLGDHNTVEKHSHTHINNNYGGYQSKIVKNLDTGEIFESQKAAAESIGVNIQSMSRHLNGNFGDLKGYTFERIGFGTV